MGAVKKDSSGYAGLSVPGRYYIYNRRQHNINPNNFYISGRYPERNAYSFFYPEDILHKKRRRIPVQSAHVVSALGDGNPWNNPHRSGHHYQPRKKYHMHHHNGHTNYKTTRRRLFPPEDISYTKPSILVRRSHSYPQTTLTPSPSVDYTDHCPTPRFPVTKHVRILEPELDEWNSDAHSVCSEYDNLLYVDSSGNYSLGQTDEHLVNNSLVPNNRQILTDIKSVHDFTQHGGSDRSVVNEWSPGQLDSNNSVGYQGDIHRSLSESTEPNFSQSQGYSLSSDNGFDSVESPLSLCWSPSNYQGYRRPLHALPNGINNVNLQPFNLVNSYDFNRSQDNVDYLSRGYLHLLDSDTTPKFPVTTKDINTEFENTRRWQHLPEEYDNVTDRITATKHATNKLVNVPRDHSQYAKRSRRRDRYHTKDSSQKTSKKAFVNDIKALLALVEAEKLWLSQIEQSIIQKHKHVYFNHVNSKHKHWEKKAHRRYSCCVCCC